MSLCKFYCAVSSEKPEMKFKVLSWHHGVFCEHAGDRSYDSEDYNPISHQDFVITKYMDLNSPLLFKFVCDQTKMERMEITVDDYNEYDYNGDKIETPHYPAKLKFSNVQVMSITISGAEGGIPTESMNVAYETLEVVVSDHQRKESVSHTITRND